MSATPRRIVLIFPSFTGHHVRLGRSIRDSFSIVVGAAGKFRAVVIQEHDLERLEGGGKHGVIHYIPRHRHNVLVPTGKGIGIRDRFTGILFRHLSLIYRQNTLGKRTYLQHFGTVHKGHGVHVARRGVTGHKGHRASHAILVIQGRNPAGKGVFHTILGVPGGVFGGFNAAEQGSIIVFTAFIPIHLDDTAVVIHEPYRVTTNSTVVSCGVGRRFCNIVHIIRIRSPPGKIVFVFCGRIPVWIHIKEVPIVYVLAIRHLGRHKDIAIVIQVFNGKGNPLDAIEIGEIVPISCYLEHSINIIPCIGVIGTPPKGVFLATFIRFHGRRGAGKFRRGSVFIGVPVPFIAIVELDRIQPVARRVIQGVVHIFRGGGQHRGPFHFIFRAFVAHAPCNVVHVLGTTVHRHFPFGKHSAIQKGGSVFVVETYHITGLVQALHIVDFYAFTVTAQRPNKLGRTFAHHIHRQVVVVIVELTPVERGGTPLFAIIYSLAKVLVIYPVWAFHPKGVGSALVIVLNSTAIRQVQRSARVKRQAKANPSATVTMVRKPQNITGSTLVCHLLRDCRLIITHTCVAGVIPAGIIIVIHEPICSQTAGFVAVLKIIDDKGFSVRNLQHGAWRHGNRRIYGRICRRFRSWRKFLVPTHKFIIGIYRRCLERSNIRGEAGDSARHEIVIIQVRKVIVYKFDFVLIHRYINSPFDYGFPIFKLPVKFWNGIPFKNPARQFVIVRHGCLGRSTIIRSPFSITHPCRV